MGFASHRRFGRIQFRKPIFDGLPFLKNAERLFHGCSERGQFFFSGSENVSVKLIPTICCGGNCHGFFFAEHDVNLLW